MRRESFWIAAGCVLVLAGLLPAFSSDATPNSKEKVIYSFTGGADGAQPLSDLILDSEGNLYGTTNLGGTFGGACGGIGCGTVFELKRSGGGWTADVLHSFVGGLDGAGPEAGLIFDGTGSLYGTTEFGGIGDCGTVFRLTPDSHGKWTENVIYSFPSDGSAGLSPQADLMFDAQGNLYGTTSQGGYNGRCANQCGTVFELTPQANGSWAETTIHAFTGPPDGGNPSSGLVLDAGDFYGVTEYGGTGSCRYTYPSGSYAGGCGTVYRLTHNSDGGWTENVIYSFVGGGGRGKDASGGLLFDDKGHLLGTSLAGGDGLGTVFELEHVPGRGWQEDELHIFYGVPDGAAPTGTMIADANGDLFGVTNNEGRRRGNSIVFRLQHSGNGWKEKILHTFSGTPDGENPSAGLVSDSQGRLYGTTSAGGSNNFGAVYEITP